MCGNFTPPFWEGIKVVHFVYLLKNNNSKHMYVGYTGNIKQRVSDHNKGLVEATKRYLPLKLVYYEAYTSKLDAINREYKLKHHGSVIGHLKKRTKNSLK